MKFPNKQTYKARQHYLLAGIGNRDKILWTNFRPSGFTNTSNTYRYIYIYIYNGFGTN